MEGWKESRPSLPFFYSSCTQRAVGVLHWYWLKHRAKSSKLKYEHALIEGLRPSWKALRPGKRFIRLFPDELDRPRVEQALLASLV